MHAVVVPIRVHWVSPDVRSPALPAWATSSLDAECRFNKLYVPVFFYHTLRYMWTAEKHVIWNPSEMSLCNTVLATPLLFIVYDFFYSFFHRALHHRRLCVLVHCPVMLCGSLCAQP